MNSETQRDSSVILRLTRDLQPENLRPLQVGEVQNFIQTYIINRKFVKLILELTLQILDVFKLIIRIFNRIF